MSMTENKTGFLIVVIIVTIASASVTYLLVNIFEKKRRAKIHMFDLLRLRSRTPTLKNGKPIGRVSMTAIGKQLSPHARVSVDTAEASRFLKKRLNAIPGSNECSWVTPSPLTTATDVVTPICFQTRSKPNDKPSLNRVLACTAMHQSCRCTASLATVMLPRALRSLTNIPTMN